MRAILLIVPALLVWFADSAFVLLAGLYLAGAAWLTFECWRAPLVDEHGLTLADSIENTNPRVADVSRTGSRN